MPNPTSFIFKAVSVLLAAAAFFFWYGGNGDGAFLSAVAACVSFFLSVRFEVKKRRESEREGGEL